MNNQTLPLPNPSDWMTIDAAAELLGCSRRTVTRLMDSGALNGYQPARGKTETDRWLLWRPEVDEVLQARRRLAPKE
jgi:excisionase family DNA binding protein